MMKINRAVIASLILSSVPLLAQAVDPDMDFDPPKDSAQEIWQYQTERFNAVLAELKTHEYFAGTLVNLSFRGQSFTIDRRKEIARRTPGNPPPRLETLGSLIGGLSAEARGGLEIKVHREYNADGTVKSEDWSIKVDGSWSQSVQTGMDDATGKQHK